LCALVQESAGRRAAGLAAPGKVHPGNDPASHRI